MTAKGRGTDDAASLIFLDREGFVVERERGFDGDDVVFAIVKQSDRRRTAKLGKELFV